jgi:hypothetical protein
MAGSSRSICRLAPPSTTLVQAFVPAHTLTAIYSAPRRLLSSTNSPSTRPIPPPTPFVPDLSTFFKLIGRDVSQYASKFETWEAFFTLPSREFLKLNIEPAAKRKYLLEWRERFRQGRWGIGGDFTQVDRENECAYLRVVEAPTKLPSPATSTIGANMKRIVVNVAPKTFLPHVDPKTARTVQYVTLGNNRIRGKNVFSVAGYDGQLARLMIQDGLWEVRKGRKVDGGERRKAEVRAKRRSEERKKAEGAA